MILIVLWILIAAAGTLGSLGTVVLLLRQQSRVPVALRNIDHHLVTQAELRATGFALMTAAGLLAAFIPDLDLRMFLARLAIIAALGVFSFKAIEDFLVQWQYDRKQQRRK